MAFASSCGPVSASIAPYCAKAFVHDTLLMTSPLKAGASQSGTIPYPSRQPVIAKVLLKPSSVIVRSAMPGSVAIESGSPSYWRRP